MKPVTSNSMRDAATWATTEEVAQAEPPVTARPSIGVKIRIAVFGVVA
jgi:hypothetical protein